MKYYLSYVSFRLRMDIDGRGEAGHSRRLVRDTVVEREHANIAGDPLGRKHAELSHLGEDVDDPPGLRDPATGDPEDEDLVVRDGPAGRRAAHVLALVGPGDRVPADDLVSFGAHVLDRDVQVGEGSKERGEHLLQRLRPGRLDGQRRTDQDVRLDDLVDRLVDELRVAAVDGLMQAAERRLVAGRHGSSSFGCAAAGVWRPVRVTSGFRPGSWRDVAHTQATNEHPAR